MDWTHKHIRKPNIDDEGFVDEYLDFCLKEGAKMGIGPFTTYAPPGVYTQTITEPVVGQLLTGLRVPVLIGTGRETLSQTDFEIVRGSSSQADTPIFGEDVSNRWVVGGTSTNPTLGAQDGTRTQFRVRNYPIVDGQGIGKATFDPSKVSVQVNGSTAIVSSIDGPNGIVTLLVPPNSGDFVTINYYFHRKDTRIADDVSTQVTAGSAILIAPKAETYSITASTNQLQVYVNDLGVSTTIVLNTGATRLASDVANDINVAGVTGLTASVHVDNQGLNHVQLVATGNVKIGTGTANGALGFNVGDYTNRNASFRVFNGPIVDGSDGGITTTDPSKVTVKVNGTQVLAASVDGANRLVTLQAAPPAGATVTIEYWFNSWQDTFDYLPNSNITSVGNVGIAPGRKDYINGPDFVVINQGSQSIIQWGTAFLVNAGIKTGSANFDSTQITGILIDNRIYGALCDRFVDTVTSTVSTTKFVLPLSPTTGNGRDTPLSRSIYNSITNGRIDLLTDNPNLVTAYVGKTWRDAFARGPVTVTQVDGVTNTITLSNPVPADYQVFATFWYNLLADDTYTFTVVTPGPTGIGQYTITSALTGKNSYGIKFGTKSALPQTIQWPSGTETIPDAIIYGGNPVAETVTVTFSTSVEPGSHASVTNANSDPYDIYYASRNFGSVIVDGNAGVTTDLSVGYRAQLLGSSVTNPLAFLSTDRLTLSIDGVIVTTDVSAATTVAAVVTAINAVIDVDTQVHPDGTGTFASTSPNNLVSALSYGSGFILKVGGRNLQTFTNGFVSSVQVLIPTGVGQTDASTKLGLSPNLLSTGSYSAINQVALVAGTAVAPFAITAGLNDQFALNVDGVDFNVVLPSGPSVPLSDVVAAINDAYIAYASAADVSQYVTDSIAVANALRAAYEAHRISTVFHVVGDATNAITAVVAIDQATAITLANDIKAKFDAHLTQVTVHQTDDAFNGITVVDATNLVTLVALVADLKRNFNLHLHQNGIHGHDDTINVSVAPAAVDLPTSETLLNDIKTQYNLHRVFTASHTINDTVNIVTATNAIDLPTSEALANDIKAKLNAHFAQNGVHPYNDTTNTVSTPNATDLPTTIALANALQAAYNAHRTQLQGLFHVHGTYDTTNTVSTSMTELVAHTGAGVNAGKLVLTSRVNTPNSAVVTKAASTCLVVLGFLAGVSTGRHQPTASDIAAALNATTSFQNLAVAYKINVPGLGNYLEINSRTVGTTSTLAFGNVANSALIPDTGLGIVPGVTGDIGQAAQSGFIVTSSDVVNGSSGTGQVGQTYTDNRTGLRFSILAASAGDYAAGGSFTFIVNQTFTCDSAIPIHSVYGVEVTVTNTVNMNPGTTGVLTTYKRTGNHPKVGDVYYISYQYAKTDLSTQLYQDFKKIQANFGSPTPDNPLSLGARLAILNGAVLVGLKQVLKTAGTSQAPTGSYLDAIDELRKPISGNIKPDVITPLATDPTIFAYLNQHCVFMSSPRQEGERIGVIGSAIGTTTTGIQAIAKGIQSELMILVYPDSFIIPIQDDNGNITQRLIDGSFVAACLAGSMCSPNIDVATPLTRRSVAGPTQLGRILDPTEANQVAVAGVSVIEQVDSGLRVRHGLTTRVDNVLTRTPSVTLTIQFVQQTMRRTLDPYIGQKFVVSLPKQVEKSMVGSFQNLINAQIVNKVSGINATVDDNDPTIMRTEAIYVPVFPLEYIVSTLQVRIRALRILTGIEVCSRVPPWNSHKLQLRPLRQNPLGPQLYGRSIVISILNPVVVILV